MQGQRGDRVGRTSTTHEKAQAAAVAPTNARELERVSEIDALLIVFDGWRETATGREGFRANYLTQLEGRESAAAAAGVI